MGRIWSIWPGWSYVRNLWAVRFLYWHILNRGLCLRPPWSMVEHIWDSQGTNAKEAGKWTAAPLRPCPPIPSLWPMPNENGECPKLSRAACGEKPTIPKRVYHFGRRMIGIAVRGMTKIFVPAMFKGLISEQNFHPGFLGLFLNPFYFARKGLHENVVALAPSIRGRTLDVGCGSKPYKKYCNATKYLGLEIKGRNEDADYHYDGTVFPFENEQFDSVLTSQVLEHVFNPHQFLSEINRVTKVGGVLLITVPFVWDEHEQPFDYARYSSFGLRYLLQNHGFEIIESRKSMDDIRVIFQMINAYIYKKTVTNSSKLNFFLTLTLMAPFNILGEILAAILPRNPDLYLDNVVLARKISNMEHSTAQNLE